MRSCSNLSTSLIKISSYSFRNIQLWFSKFPNVSEEYALVLYIAYYIEMQHYEEEQIEPTLASCALIARVRWRIVSSGGRPLSTRTISLTRVVILEIILWRSPPRIQKLQLLSYRFHGRHQLDRRMRQGGVWIFRNPGTKILRQILVVEWGPEIHNQRRKFICDIRGTKSLERKKLESRNPKNPKNPKS